MTDETPHRHSTKQGAQLASDTVESGCKKKMTKRAYYLSENTRENKAIAEKCGIKSGIIHQKQDMKGKQTIRWGAP